MALGDDLVVAAVLLLVIFLFVVISLQLCFDACYRSHDLASSSSSQSATWRRGGGDPEALPSPAVTVYRTAARSKDDEEGDAAAECAVCLAGLEDGEEARFMPCCGHGFHAQCVGTWLAMASRPTCPLCRIAVARPPGVAAAPASTSSALPQVPSEPANYATYLPAARFSDQGAC